MHRAHAQLPRAPAQALTSALLLLPLRVPSWLCLLVHDIAWRSHQVPQHSRMQSCKASAMRNMLGLKLELLLWKVVLMRDPLLLLRSMAVAVQQAKQHQRVLQGQRNVCVLTRAAAMLFVRVPQSCTASRNPSCCSQLGQCC